MRLALVIAGGGLGTVARYFVGLWMAGRFSADFPWATLSVNVAGAFLIGLLATMADENGAIGADARAFLIIGILGGFTTFSSFALEWWRLAEGGNSTNAVLYIAASLVLSGVAVTAGIVLGRAVA